MTAALFLVEVSFMMLFCMALVSSLDRVLGWEDRPRWWEVTR